METVVKMVAGPSGAAAEGGATGSPLARCFGGAFAGRRVLVTGDTGFKGSWLCEWLLELGADVTGFALPPPTAPALFDQLGLGTRMRHVNGDVRDGTAVRRLVAATRPEFVFHLAAQPLVRRSYAEPVETYATNVMGTVNLLDALRHAGVPCTAVMITTDKCYENREWVHAYREEDMLGGHDPYSSSKGAAELVIAAYRHSFFGGDRSNIRVASARAGNVIGGGDWAEDRILPDCIRCLRLGQVIPVRSRWATRPWQHVLESLSGYLLLATMLAAPSGAGETAACRAAFNFGPPLASNRSVADLVQAVLRHWPGRWEERNDATAVHEALRLNLATDKAYHELGWRPIWDFDETVEKTVVWYRAVIELPSRALELTRTQLQEYVGAARRGGVTWAATERQKG